MLKVALAGPPPSFIGANVLTTSRALVLHAEEMREHEA